MVEAVTFQRSLQCAGMALQSFGQAHEFLILKPEVSEKLPARAGLWQQVCIPETQAACIKEPTAVQCSNNSAGTGQGSVFVCV